MNNIRRFKYIIPIYKKSIIVNKNLYKKHNCNLLNNNLDLSKKQDLSNNLVIYKKPSSDLVLYNKPDLGLILYNLDNKLGDYKFNKFNKYLYIYILFKIAYFINLI